MSVEADHRAQQTPIRDQGPRDTCVAFAVSAAHEWMAAGTGLRSPEDALWSAHQIGGLPNIESTTIEWALRGIDSNRHADEEAWPYGNPSWPAPRPAPASVKSAQLSLPPWREVLTPGFQSIAAEASAGLAVLLSIRVVVEAWRTVTGFVDAAPGRIARQGHAVLIVGAGADSNGDHLIFKNSWGVAWGALGFGLLSRRYVEAYIKRAFILERP